MVSLQSVQALTIVCEDCGRTKVWKAPQIARAARRGARTVADLGRRLACIECQAFGGDGDNVIIRLGAHPSPDATTLCTEMTS